jgi:quinoprotein glucose dehydrogenase
MLLALLTTAVLVDQTAAEQSTSQIWDGIYTASQADRGRAVFQSTCTTCHNFDLKGNAGRGPALVGDAFMMNWEAENLNTLFTRLKTTMPRNNPGSLADNTYLDLLAYVLQANAFPEGTKELNLTDLTGISMVRRDGRSAKDVPNFALVSIVGCLNEADDRWVLTHTSEPLTAEERPATEVELKDAGSRRLGSSTFKLLGAYGYKPGIHKGHKVLAQGLLYRLGDDNRLNVTGLQTVSVTCPG